MAASKKKTIISKDDLRRLMKEKQTSLKSEKKKIDSPLARGVISAEIAPADQCEKIFGPDGGHHVPELFASAFGNAYGNCRRRYNNLGQLSCVLCNAPVKNELLWNAHIIGKTHKESLARLKAEKEKKEQAVVQPAIVHDEKKRKLTDEEILAVAKGLKPLPNKNKNKKAKISSVDGGEAQQAKPRSILKTSITYQQQQAGGSPCGLNAHQSVETHDSDDQNVQTTTTATSKTTLPNSLPPDFFESGVDSEPPVEGSSDKPVAELSEKLPEGFFDDPKQDAKIRQVEYKDKLDEEWEMFQRVINEETHTSEAIQAEDDEEANEERHLMEVEEQLKKWSEIDKLAKMKEKLMTHEKERTGKQNDDESDESVDEQEFDEFLDWRSKKAWK